MDIHTQRAALMERELDLRRTGRVRGRIRIGDLGASWRPLLLQHLVDVARHVLIEEYAEAEVSGVRELLDILKRRYLRMKPDEDPAAILRRFIAVVKQGDFLDSYRRHGTTVVAARRRDNAIARGELSGERGTPRGHGRGPTPRRRPPGQELVEHRAEAGRSLDARQGPALPPWISDAWLDRAEAAGYTYDFELDDDESVIVTIYGQTGDLRATYRSAGDQYRKEC